MLIFVDHLNFQHRYKHSFLYRFNFRLEVRNKATIVLCELLFNDKMFKEKQIEKYSNLMLRFTHENQKAQKYLLGGIEKTVEVHEAVLMPRVPHILKALYEEDILEEEVLFEWAKKVGYSRISPIYLLDYHRFW